MLEAAAKAIEAAANVIGDMRVTATLYSGRGMCGKQTWGVTTDSSYEMLGAVAYAAAELARDEIDKEVDLTVDDFVEEVTSLTTDSMGRGTIWY